MRGYFSKIPFLILFLLCFNPTAARSAESDHITGVSVGIEGAYKNGFRTPITVEYTGSQAKALRLLAVDSDGTPAALSEPLEEGSGRRTLYFPLGKANGTLTVQLLDSEKNVLDEKQLDPRARTARQIAEKFMPPFFFTDPLPPEKSLVLLVGDDAIGLEQALAELRVKDERRPVVKRVERFESLPDRWIGYEAVETLVITTTDPDFFKSVRSDDVRMKTIERWVESGGRVVLLAGRDSLPLVTGDGALSRLVPGELDATRVREIRIANAITQYVPKAKNLVMTGSADAPFLNVPVISKVRPDARVELAEMETPMLVRAPRGFGAVTWFAADLARPPISVWSGRNGLVIKLFNLDSDNTRKTSENGMLVQLGFNDLSGQLRSTLDRFEGVGNIPFSIILLLAFVYILLIGPGDWYLTRRVFKRPNTTWITFPIYIVLFCALVVWLGVRTNPNDVKINWVDLIDVDQSSGMVRGTSWAGVYSPIDARYSFALDWTDTKPATERADCYFSWLGLQGTGLGAMAPKTISIPFWHDPYTFESNPAGLTAVPIQIHASKSLTARRLGQMPSLAKSDLRDFDSIPVGKLVNPLDQPLENAILFYDRWALDLGTLAPGGKKIDLKIPKTESHLVVGTTETPFDTTRSVSQIGLNRYNTETASIPYIMRAMSFFRLAGGYDALGLDNSLQHYVDLTDQVLYGRAVLIGTVRDNVPTSGDDNRISLEGVPTDGAGHVRPCRATVVFRMVIPVGK